MVSDFGVSRPRYVEGPPTWDAVTYWYAAPEQLEETCCPTTKTDVFAFGLVLYEMIGGEPVFSANLGLKQVVLRLRAHNLPSIPDNFGALMQGLIPRCWSPNPKSRPSFQAILEEFQSVDFAILPNVDPSAIKEAVCEVLTWEAQRK
jgi:serine/threonine protein kinase